MPITFWINSMGEAGRNECAIYGTIDLRDLEHELGRSPTQIDINRAFNHEAERVMTGEEHKLYVEWKRFFKLVCGVTPFFRFYAQIEDKKPRIQLECEFHIKKGHKAWKTLDLLASNWHATVGEMNLPSDAGCMRKDFCIEVRGMIVNQVKYMIKELERDFRKHKISGYLVSVT